MRPPTAKRSRRSHLSRPGPRPNGASAFEGSSGVGRSSLRAELLLNLGFLAAAALLLAFWVDDLLRFRGVADPFSFGWPLLLVALDLVIFLALGRHLVDRFVLRPLNQTVAAAEAIAAGDYERRLPRGPTREMEVLARALNHLTDQLLRNQALLAENVRSLDETNRRLLAAQRDAVQAEKLASIGRLAAGVAHEIGNPLGALLGYAAVLRRRGADPELIGGVEGEAKRIDRIVRGLLDYARPGAVRREQLDLNECIRSILGWLREQKLLGDIEVELRLAPELPAVEAGTQAIEQIFGNLFTNATQAMGGRGRLTVITATEHWDLPDPGWQRRADDPPEIDFSHLRRTARSAHDPAAQLRPGEEVVRVTVCDTGPGIPAELLATLWDPFVTTKAPGQGTGLGLAIVASTLAELGGGIEVANLEGGGACFTLFFPTVPDRDAEPA